MYVKETVADAHGGAGPYFILSNCAATPTTCGRTSSAPLLNWRPEVVWERDYVSSGPEKLHNRTQSSSSS